MRMLEGNAYDYITQHDVVRRDVGRLNLDTFP